MVKKDTAVTPVVNDNTKLSPNTLRKSATTTGTDVTRIKNNVYISQDPAQRKIGVQSPTKNIRD